MRYDAISITQLLLSVSLCAGHFEERQSRDLRTNPGDLQFRLITRDSSSRFHAGERIPIRLEFSSTSPDKYLLNAATYDRSGRLPTEEFILERDIADPYQDYFGAGVLGGMSGGLRDIPVLGPKPYSVDLELNEWFRF